MLQMRHGLIVLLSTTTLCLLGVPLMPQIILLFVVWCYIEQRFLKCAILTAPRDHGERFVNRALGFGKRDHRELAFPMKSTLYRGLWMLFTMQWKLWRLSRQQCTVHKLFDIVASRTPDSVALEEVESGQTWTFAQLQWHSMRLAGYFREECNLHPGDVVALFLPNSAYYVIYILSLSRIGVIPALINFNLRLDSLAHCIRVSNANSIIVGESLIQVFKEALPCFSKQTIPVIYAHIKNKQFGKLGANFIDLNAELENSSAELVKSIPEVGFKSILFYIFTSGTTGMPKAATITHARYFLMALGVHLAFSIRKSDRIYVTMPMYHTAAIILGIGQTLLSGCTCIIRSRFSASQYWHDCLRYRCTAAQYIGEMCRYLLLQPPKEIDRKHGVRLMYGNGLRIQIWKEFVKRFGIEKIGEFYGSTEGNTSVLNIDNHVGACGFMTIYSFLSIVYPIALIKVDETTGELMRDERGLCIRCKPGESGEMVGRIIRGNPLKDFTGYVCDSDSQKKITRDVFRKNDIAFRSGDILYYDELGYLFFKDRTGDTYRWKGENVSTTEVEGLIQKITSHNDAVVYGVSVPGYEGRAGMAAIVDLNSTLDVNHLHEQMTIFLPKYAQPIFLRICQKVTSTSTYKLCKTELVKEGFNPVSCISDQLYVLNHEKDAYEVLDALKYQDIIEGRMNI
ncbi:Long-chain fatty acid transport protein 1 [Trichinella spiralis]|uniref:Very long-chain fatty acid transport protein n=1 Tax=Trichinella spiralis TaxID=6334 RepID=A0A0V1BIX2_TRISP|nr:Long-chain fatty acid transport protein 1 [Trichinella spiralis]